MINTLNKYIGRDILRICLLATCAFTLIMTAFSVIEPLRKDGLAGAKVLTLFWFLAPAMMTLTLPIAMLFATTFVYGRYGMDNELTASKAGGISSLSLMLPAVLGGVIVGITTLVLSNHVVPELARRGEMLVKQNIKGFVYQKLKRDSSVELPEQDWLIHADETDPENDLLKGLVVFDMSDWHSYSYYTASVAKVEFEQENGQITISIIAINPTYGDVDNNRIQELGHFVYGPKTLDDISIRDKAGFYTWGELLATLDDPRNNHRIQEDLKDIYEHLRRVYFASEVAAVINQGRSYELSHMDGYRYVFSAPFAESGKGGHLILRSLSKDEDFQVELNVYSLDNSLVRTMKCKMADFDIIEYEDSPKVTAELSEVEVHLSPEISDSVVRKKRYPVGLMELPSSVHKRIEGVTLEQLYNSPEQFPSVDNKTKLLEKRIRDKLRPKILAEINSRLAYGLGCILLIPIGAALGLRYKGGHILSAFALSCIPAVILIVLMVMGRQMVTNQDANSSLGMVAIWSGVGILGCIMAWLGATSLRN